MCRVPDTLMGPGCRPRPCHRTCQVVRVCQVVPQHGPAVTARHQVRLAVPVAREAQVLRENKMSAQKIRG